MEKEKKKEFLEACPSYWEKTKGPLSRLTFFAVFRVASLNFKKDDTVQLKVPFLKCISPVAKSMSNM